MEFGRGIDGGAGARGSLRTGHWIGFVGSWFLLVMGMGGLLRGTLGALGAGGICLAGTAGAADACPPVSPESVPVGILLAGGGVLLGVFVARDFGVPAAPWAPPLFFCAEGLAFLIAASRSAGGVSIPLLLLVALCAGLATASVVGLRPVRGGAFLGRRRLDGGEQAVGRLPRRDAAVIALAWALAVAAGVLFAAALS